MSCRLLERYFAEKHGDDIDKSFRGIPVGMNICDSKNFTYGSLRISTYDSSCLIITMDSRVGEEKRSFDWRRVHHNSVGELITNGIYEGDILIHEDYPGYLFEPQYVNGGWKPCVIYGSEGTPELSGFPKDFRDYKIHSWKFEHHLWYADSSMGVMKPKEDLIFLGSIEKDTDNLFLTPGDDGLFRDAMNIFYESDMGDYGKIIITETTFGGNSFYCHVYPEKTIKDAIEWNPTVGYLLRKRKLISF